MCPLPSPWTVNITFMKSDEADVPIVILHQGRAVFHPIPAVHVEHVSDGTDLRAVNMSTDHPVHAAFPAEPDHGFLVIGDILHGRLGLQLDVGSERPVAKPKVPPD